ncbi:glycoside hydrolase [Morchella conica CCBAS932]|uniref:glucan 1,3-beta-glucosidase n=1 Tax=Morchella conica CCBAS932 TaxID=1392247 RepID=A0A3N4L4W2_9PEZI|nr:glycoside hydrolase [Morchella conica CCBAS932]
MPRYALAHQRDDSHDSTYDEIEREKIAAAIRSERRRERDLGRAESRRPRRGESRRGDIGRGESRRGESRHGESRRRESRRGESRHGEGRRGESRRGNAQTIRVVRSESTEDEWRHRGGDLGERPRRKSRTKRKSRHGIAIDGANDEDLEAAERLRGRRSRSRSAPPPPPPPKKRRCGRRFWILLGITILLLVILIPVGIVVAGKKKAATSSADGTGLGKGASSGDISNIDPNSVPSEYKGTYLDPFTWLDTTDFNLTFTDKKVGGLSVMGLFDDYDDSTKANPSVPALNEKWNYGTEAGTNPIRGVNVGGWLIIEPFITPSFFDAYSSAYGVVDEYTLTKTLGESKTKETVEKHYSTFVNEATFKGIRDAGLDHVRIPFGYWAVFPETGDPYLPNVGWRYLLRAIEYCRKYGLRVKLDLHSVYGGANGWNHSGRLGPINWLNGTDGELNGQKTLDLHAGMAEFFAQSRYKNIVTMYGLVNEPKMIYLDPQKVIDWSTKAHTVIRKAGYEGYIIFGDGFRGLTSWKGAFDGLDKLVLDVHQYVIFNVGQLSASHTAKVNFACIGWSQQLAQSLNTSTGFGPTIVGEWGQADTDCTPYLNNVGVGSRWEGTLNTTDGTAVSKPSCPSGTDCSCEKANADASTYTAEYKQFLKMFAIAQMDAFEVGWGWMYWTWDTEKATQWSYKKGMAAGILPTKAYDRDWSCSGNDVPDFLSLGLPESY